MDNQEKPEGAKKEVNNNFKGNTAKDNSDPLDKAIGIWKDRWPESMSSVEIARKLRENHWRRT